MSTVTETSTPVFSDFADPRLRRRRTIRLRMAERDLIIQQRREVESASRSLDQELDAATSKHQSTCEPIQNEIRTLEMQRCELIADRKDVPASLDMRRRELLDLLRAANDELEKAAEDHKARVAVLNREIKTIAESEKRYSDLTPFSLAHPDVANPHLSDLLWIAQRAVEFAKHRHDAAFAKCKIYESEIRNERNPQRASVATLGNTSFNGQVRGEINSDRISIYSDRLRRWRLELATSQKLLADAMRESESAHQKILDE